MFKEKEDEILNLGFESINVYEYNGNDYAMQRKRDKEALRD